MKGFEGGVTAGEGSRRVEEMKGLGMEAGRVGVVLRLEEVHQMVSKMDLLQGLAGISHS